MPDYERSFDLRKIALGFSIIYHPLLLTTLLVMTMLWFAPNTMGRYTYEGKWVLTGMFALLTFALPMFLIIVLRLTSNISDLMMDDRKERIIPLAITTILYGITTYWVAFKYQMSMPMISLILSVTITVAGITLITFFWKISAHSASAWGGVGIFVAFLQKTSEIQLLTILVVAVIMAGIVSSSRLYLKAHNLSQILLGGVFGFLVCFISVYLML